MDELAFRNFVRPVSGDGVCERRHHHRRFLGTTVLENKNKAQHALGFFLSYDFNQVPQEEVAADKCMTHHPPSPSDHNLLQ